MTAAAFTPRERGSAAHGEIVEVPIFWHDPDSGAVVAGTPDLYRCLAESDAIYELRKRIAKRERIARLQRWIATYCVVIALLAATYFALRGAL